MIVCIDGPAASGKSTVSAKLAKSLEIIHLNSGALFRAVALKAVEFKRSDYAVLASELKFNFDLNSDGTTSFLVDGEDISSSLTNSEVAETASVISLNPKLREVLVYVQRQVAQLNNNSIVVEGRDAGTVVFPKADYKFFLDASLEVRAKRRYADLLDGNNKSGISKSYEDFKKDLDKRGKRDQGRKLAPTIAASDAIVVDTNTKSLEQVLEFIKTHIG